MQIQQLSTNSVIPYARNPRKNDAAVDKVAASIKEFGWKQPIVVDSENVVIAGHTRLLAAKKLGCTEVPVHVASDLTASQIKAYRIADNRVAQEAQWDIDLLSLELDELQGSDVDLFLTGFNADELDSILAIGDATPEGLTDEDEVPELLPVEVSSHGDVWVLGKHCLMCGDCTNVNHVESVLNQKTADLCLTDPPYGLNKTQSGKNNYVGYEDTRENLIDLVKQWLPLAREKAVVTVFSPGITNQWLYPEPDWVMSWFYGGGQLRSQWGFNCWQPFLCYGKDPSLASRNGGKPDAVNLNVPANESDLKHPCPKPVKLWDWFIERLVYSPNAIIYEPFCGSGTTIIAAEKKGIAVCALELTPMYVDLTVRRWQNFTGKKAVLESSGKTFDELEQSKEAA